jgi:hypothetical protein
VEATPEVRQFMNDISRATRKASLSGGNDYEKFLTVGRGAGGELIVTSIAALRQGGQWSPPPGTISHLHVHWDLLVQPPNAADDNSARVHGYASFVVGEKDKNLYEVGRKAGQSVVRLVRPNGTAGTWLPYLENGQGYYSSTGGNDYRDPYSKEW